MVGRVDRHSHDAEWERGAECGGAEGVGEELGSSPRLSLVETGRILLVLELRFLIAMVSIPRLMPRSSSGNSRDSTILDCLIVRLPVPTSSQRFA